MSYRHSATCDGCRSTIIGTRYKCTSRHNFDFCSKCFEARDEKGMKNHNWNVMENTSSVTGTVEEKAPDLSFRHSASCDGCRQGIKGIRYKCATRGNYDFCSDCFSKRASKGMAGHNWNVMEYKSSVTKTITEKAEEQNLKFRHSATCDGCRGGVVGIRYKCTSKHNFDFCSDCFEKRESKGMKGHTWNLMEYKNEVTKSIDEKEESSGENTKFRHTASCDGCRGSIVGVRYKCTSRNNFDFCSKCFDVRGSKGMKEHTWDVLEYKNEVTKKIDEKPKSTNSFRHSATCDGCRNGIVGVRYKCTSKHNFDFCSGCFEKRKEKGMGSHNWDLFADAGPKATGKVEEKVVQSEAFQHSATCDGCRNRIVGVRYKCTTKNNFDFCSGCFAKREGKSMAGHNWQIFPTAQASGTVEERAVVEAKKVEKVTPEPAVKKKEVVVEKGYSHSASCDGCRGRIFGNRYKCKSRSNYDFCSACFEKRVEKNMGGHNWSVYENCARETRTIEEKAVLEKVEQKITSVKVSKVAVQKEKSAEGEGGYTHRCSCDGCRKKVIGLRYQCSTQRNFDFCESCFAERGSKRMGNHNWKVHADGSGVAYDVFEKVSSGGSNVDILEGDALVKRRLQAQVEAVSETVKSKFSNLEYAISHNRIEEGLKTLQEIRTCLEPLREEKFQEFAGVVQLLKKPESYVPALTTKPVLREFARYEELMKKMYSAADGCGKGTLPNTPFQTHMHYHEGFYDSPWLKFGDSEIFMRVYEFCGNFLEKMKQKVQVLPALEADIGDLRARIQDMMERVIKRHPKHCINAFLRVRKDCREIYLKALECFPKAREYCMFRLKLLKYSYYENRMEEVCDDKQFKCTDPCKGSSKTPFEEQEYETFELIRPNNPKLSLAERKSHAKWEDSNTKFWTSHQKKYAGKIAFSPKVIEKTDLDDKGFKKEFHFQKDEIFARVYWPTAVYKIAVGVDKKTGEPLYPPLHFKDKNHFNRISHELEFVVICKIDGKKVEIKGNKFKGEIASTRERSDNEKGLNFYKRAQTMKIWVSLKKPDFFDSYQLAAQKFNALFAKLKPGKHTIDLDLCYRILSTSNNIDAQEPVFPPRNTPLSLPIASGGFVLRVPKKCVLANPLPPPTCTVPNSREIEEKIKTMLRQSREWGQRADKTEDLIWVSTLGDLYVSEYSWWERQKYIAQYGLNFYAVMYRNPQKGWRKEHCRIFNLSVYTPFVEKQNCLKKMPPVLTRPIGVGGGADFDADLIPETVLKQYGVKKCPPELADWYDELSEEDKKQMGIEY